MATPTTPILANRYHLDSIVYSDSTVVAYHARDQILNRAVTVELLRPDKAKDQTYVQRILDKARNAALANLPHVAALYDQNSIDQRPFLVLEELAGPPLADLAPLHADKAIDLIEKLAATLEAGLASQQPLPEINDQTIRISPEGRVQVLDLGLEQMPPAHGYAVKTLGRILSATIAGADLSRAAPLRGLAERANNGEYQTVGDFLLELRSLRQRADTPTTVIPRMHPTIPIPNAATSAPLPGAAPARASRAGPVVPPAEPPIVPSALADRQPAPQPRWYLWGIAVAGLILIVLAGSFALRDRDTAQTPPAASAGESPAPSASASASAAPRGEIFVVSARGSRTLVVREGAGTNFRRITSLQNGTQVEVIGGPQAANGYNWVLIRAANVEGWCISEALRRP